VTDNHTLAANMDATSPVADSPAETLVLFYKRNGYLRHPNPDRRKAESQSYKMGYEIRLVANSKCELTILRRTIRDAGLKPGKPFAKVNRWVQPIYGRHAMERFLDWIDQYGDADNRANRS